MKDLATGEVYAGKVVSKTLLVKEHQKEKVSVISSICSKIFPQYSRKLTFNVNFLRRWSKK